MADPVRILLVDDNRAFLEAARDFIDFQPRLQVTGVAGDGPAALAGVQPARPDVILLDLNLGAHSSLPLIPELRRLAPAAWIVVLTVMEGDGYRTAALHAGADAFIHKGEMTAKLVPLIGEWAAAAARLRPGGQKG